MIKVALPKGRLLKRTAALLDQAGWELDGYSEETRLYRLASRRFSQLFLKIFQERDIPIQVAVGNYDLGICGLDWVEELMVKYPSSAIVKVKDLGYGKRSLYMATGDGATIEDFRAKWGLIRIASEYPNLAESFALRNRLRRFSVFPIWGAAEVYPPESAELALVPGLSKERLNYGLVPVGKVLSSSAFLIANKTSWENKDMGEVLSTIYNVTFEEPEEERMNLRKVDSRLFYKTSPEVLQMALPDGHQQPPTAQLLKEAGIGVKGYSPGGDNRRPWASFPWLRLKVIRPQDMPLQVANGNFDLAITGRDWLFDHLSQFPSSPVKELLDLKMGKVKLVAVVSQSLGVDNIASLRRLFGSSPLRIASEYTNIADRYARENHLGIYRVIPTWGASEAFLPEDADLLIENTETGRTLARHNLKILDTLFESTACLIGHKYPSPKKVEKIEFLTNALRKVVEAR